MNTAAVLYLGWAEVGESIVHLAVDDPKFQSFVGLSSLFSLPFIMASLYLEFD